MPPPTRLLVASIGNPGPYLSTLHSAGHTVLHSLALSLSGTSFAKSRAHGNGLVSCVPAFTATSSLTLWQSPSLMNVSGVALAAAWRAFVREQGGGEAEPRLVVRAKERLGDPDPDERDDQRGRHAARADDDAHASNERHGRRRSSPSA